MTDGLYRGIHRIHMCKKHCLGQQKLSIQQRVSQGTSSKGAWRVWRPSSLKSTWRQKKYLAGENSGGTEQQVSNTWSYQRERSLDLTWEPRVSARTNQWKLKRPFSQHEQFRRDSCLGEAEAGDPWAGTTGLSDPQDQGPCLFCSLPQHLERWSAHSRCIIYVSLLNKVMEVTFRFDRRFAKVTLIS